MGLSCGVICVIVRLAISVQYLSVTDRQTDRQTDTRRRHTALAYHCTVKTLQEALLWQRTRDTLVSIEKNLQSMNNLDRHPWSSQLLLLNGHMAHHFMFVDCCFNVFI